MDDEGVSCGDVDVYAKKEKKNDKIERKTIRKKEKKEGKKFRKRKKKTEIKKC